MLMAAILKIEADPKLLEVGTSNKQQAQYLQNK